MFLPLCLLPLVLYKSGSRIVAYVGALTFHRCVCSQNLCVDEIKPCWNGTRSGYTRGGCTPSLSFFFSFFASVRFGDSLFLQLSTAARRLKALRESYLLLRSSPGCTGWIYTHVLSNCAAPLARDTPGHKIVVARFSVMSEIWLHWMLVPLIAWPASDLNISLMEATALVFFFVAKCLNVVTHRSSFS